MLPRYKAWKMINESFNGSYSLGVKTPRSLGYVGSKLAEMGFGPPDEELDPAMLDDEENQDPDLDDEDGGEFGDLSDVPVDDELDGLDGLDGEEGGELDGLDALAGGEGGELDGLDGMDGGMGGEDGEEGDMDIAALLGGGGGLGGGPPEMGDDGEELGDMSADYDDLFGPGALDGGAGGEEGEDGPVGDQGPGAPDFGSDDLEDEDEEESDDDWDDEDDEEEDEDEESDSDDDDSKAAAFAKKKSKKFMCVDKDGKDHCDDKETVYSKKYMKAGNKGDDLSGLTTKWMKKEDADFYNSIIGAGKGEVHQKFNSGVSAPKKTAPRQPQAGEVGYAPQGRVGNLPSLGQYNEWKKLQVKKNGTKLLREMGNGVFSGEGMWTDDEVPSPKRSLAQRGFQVERPNKPQRQFAAAGGPPGRASAEDMAPGSDGRSLVGAKKPAGGGSVDAMGQIVRPNAPEAAPAAAPDGAKLAQKVAGCQDPAKLAAIMKILMGESVRQRARRTR